MALVGFLGLNIMSREGLSFRHEKLSSQKSPDSKSAGFTSLGVSIHKDQGNYSCKNLIANATKDTFCQLSKADPYLAVIGDSHSQHLFFGLKNTTNVRANHVLAVGAGGCQPAIQNGQSEDCEYQSKVNLELIKKFNSIKYVVLSANSTFIQTRTQQQYDALLNGYLNTVSQLQRLGKTVIFNIDNPEFIESPASYALNPLSIRNAYKSTKLNLHEKIPSDKTLSRDVYARFILDLGKRNKFLIFFDSYSIFCDEKSCQIFDDETLLFEDTNHLTHYGSKLVADKLQTLMN